MILRLCSLFMCGFLIVVVFKKKAHVKFLLHARKTIPVEPSAFSKRYGASSPVTLRASDFSDDSDFELDSTALFTSADADEQEVRVNKRLKHFISLQADENFPLESAFNSVFWGTDLTFNQLGISFSNLGIVCYRLGWPETALQLFSQSYRVRSAAFVCFNVVFFKLQPLEEGEVEVASVLNNMAVCWHRLNNFHAAYEDFSKAFALMEKWLPRSHPRMDLLVQNRDKICLKTKNLHVETAELKKIWQVIPDENTKNLMFNEVAAKTKKESKTTGSKAKKKK